jgi:hypothetical protein
VRSVIFEKAATWRYENLREFDRLLAGTSRPQAEEFRDLVADKAGGRDDADDLADIVLWLLRGADAGHGKQCAVKVVAKAVQRRAPGLMAQLISRLRDYQPHSGDEHKGWWTVRDAAEEQAAKSYTVDDIRGLAEAARGRCLPAVLRLAAYWLTHGKRDHSDLVNLLHGLKHARSDPRELADMIVWWARNFVPLTDWNPVGVLRQARLNDEASAWAAGKARINPWLKRPDPDRPPR